MCVTSKMKGCQVQSAPVRLTSDFHQAFMTFMPWKIKDQPYMILFWRSSLISAVSRSLYLGLKGVTHSFMYYCADLVNRSISWRTELKIHLLIVRFAVGRCSSDIFASQGAESSTLINSMCSADCVCYLASGPWFFWSFFANSDHSEQKTRVRRNKGPWFLVRQPL